MNRSGIARVGGAAALVLGASVAMGLPAQASEDGGSGTTQGTCSGDSSLKVQVQTKKDQLVIKAKVKGGVAGETWTYVIADNGTEVVGGDETSRKNGKFVVRESFPNLEGTDTINFTITDTATGETCTAEITYNG